LVVGSILGHVFAYCIACWLQHGGNEWFSNGWGSGYKYYRPAYSVFATFTLVGILIYQFKIPSENLLVIPMWVKMVCNSPGHGWTCFYVEEHTEIFFLPEWD
jgi:hypothetical protein